MNTVERLLLRAKASGQRIFYRPNVGNAGDSLINVGFFTLARRLGLSYTMVGEAFDYQTLGERDTLVFAGGGYFVPYWPATALFVGGLGVRKYRCIFLPQSLLDAAPSIQSLNEGDVMFCREPFSLKLAQKEATAGTILLDHDMAFLVDVEDVYSHPQRLGGIRPRDIIRLMLIGLHWFRSRFCGTLKAYRTDAEGRQSSTRPRLFLDVARVANFGTANIAESYRSAKWFLRVLSWYERVETDRLHVGIGRILLGRPVSMVPNAYHKINGVVAFSIRPFPDRAALIEFNDGPRR